VIHRSLDMRYCGQGYELEVPVPLGKLTRRALKAVENKFHSFHQKNYGFCKRHESTEIINLRLACVGLLSKPQLRKEPWGMANPRQAQKDGRRVFLSGKYRITTVYDREKLHPGMFIKGPAIIEQKDSTTLLFAGNSARVDQYRNIIISVKDRK
jgi:N-methylhydantoinase A